MWVDSNAVASVMKRDSEHVQTRAMIAQPSFNWKLIETGAYLDGIRIVRAWSKRNSPEKVPKGVEKSLESRNIAKRQKYSLQARQTRSW